MNFKTTLILLLLLAAAGGYVAWDRLKNADTPEKNTATANPAKLFDVSDPADVTSLAIRGPDSEVVLTALPADEKKDKNDPFAPATPAKQWRMTKPVESAANSAEVNTLVEELVRLESKAKVDPAGKGLDKPKYTVEIAAKGGKVLKFAVGDRSPLGELYLRVEGKPKADVVAASVYDRIAKPANDLRDTKLVAAKTPDITQIKIEADGQPTVALTKKGADWQVTEPRQFPADASVMTDLLGAVTNLRATDWIPKDSPDVSKARFDKPVLTVWFATTPAAPDNKPGQGPGSASAPSAAPDPASTKPTSQPVPVWTSITFGQHEDVTREKIYVQVSNPHAVVKVASTALATFQKKPLDLRDRKVMTIEPDQVSKLSIATQTPGGSGPVANPAPPKTTTVSVERRKQTAPAPSPDPTKPAPPAAPATWALLSDPKGDADAEAVQNLLADLKTLTVTKYLEAPPATATPAKTVTLALTTEGPGGTPITQHQLTLIDPGNDQPLTGSYNGLAFELSRTILSRLEGNFAKKTPQPETPAGNPKDVFELGTPRK
ncbi:MAG TPA: DUF4340 domain-containing protein [Tepidisphaeraceae bacterium]|nr:DUF4340 domain-containing protein [Tepidisphaeraceae bacterium]